MELSGCIAMRYGVLAPVLVVLVVLRVAPGATCWIMTAQPPALSCSSIQSTGCDLFKISRNRRSSSIPFYYHILRATAAGADDDLSSSSSTFAASASSTAPAIRLDDLLEMDVVVFSATTNNNNINQRQLGAVQEDGRITPLCVWTLEPAFATSLEFLVDENDLLPGYTLDDEIIIHSIVPQDKLSYGSRQVGGGMGPGNPHGEESELLYHIDQSIVDEDCIQVVVKPELEIFW